MKQVFERLRIRARSLLQGRPAPASPADPVILALLAGQSDRDLLRSAARNHQWSIAFADSGAEAQTLLASTQAPIALCDRDALASNWRPAIEELAACSRHTCILLISSVADDYLWNEVVRHGGYDVLSKPLQHDELVRAVKLAWTYSSRAMRNVPSTK